MSLLGLVLVGAVVFGALFADFIAPFPEHRGVVVDFANFNRPPQWPYLMGTDLVGRDLFSRILYAYRISLVLGVVVLADGARYLPNSWWLTIFPGLAILVAVFGFNLVGDAPRDVVGADQ